MTVTDPMADPEVRLAWAEEATLAAAPIPDEPTDALAAELGRVLRGVANLARDAGATVHYTVTVELGADHSPEQLSAFLSAMRDASDGWRARVDRGRVYAELTWSDPRG